jgi:LuxR family maltose regulon positive regulatory protein
LRRELRVTTPGRERVLHERAASWFATHGHAERATGHLLDAERYDDALELLAIDFHSYLSAGRHETLRAWLARLPDEFVTGALDRQFFVAVALARAGEVERAKALIEQAHNRLSDDDRAAYGVHLDTGLASLAGIIGDPYQAIEIGTRAWSNRHQDDPVALPRLARQAAAEFSGYLPVALARSHALLGDRDEVHRWAAVLHREGPLVPGDLVGVLGAQALVEAHGGRWRAATELANEALILAAEQGRGARRPTIGARVALTAVHRERDELDRAVEVLVPHIDTALREGHVAITTLGEVELARVECARGAGDAAIARLLHVRQDRAARGTPRFLTTVLTRAECRVRLFLGDLDRADDLLRQLDPDPERTLLDGRCALLADRPESVAPLLAELAGPGHPNRRHRFEAAALIARASVDLGDASAARRALSGVADLARLEGTVRTFRDEGFDLEDLLGSGGTGRAVSLGQARLVDPLSDRELSVLRLLPSRLSNREIGDELFVSLNTVKSHLKTVYRKLDVESRDAAVRRARQLGIL